MQAENELGRVRQQLTDLLSTSHRDISNLKKALSDMQVINNKNLATICEKGDQNLQQMQQIEDLSAIIRTRDNQIDQLHASIEDLEDKNRELHDNIRKIKEEHAKENEQKGADMMKKFTDKRQQNENQTPAKPSIQDILNKT